MSEITPDPVAVPDTEQTASPKERPSRSGVTAGVSIRNNPVLRRELIERVQGAKVVVFLTLWLALLTVILVLTYQASVAVNQGAQIDVTSLGRVGRQLFEWVLFGMLILILFLVPGLTAGAITGERERQTLVPLQMTMMRPRDIVIGKLSAALAFLMLLVIAALPLLGVSYLVGGLQILDIVRGLAMLLFTGLVLGAVCVWISARLRRTTASTVLAYGVSFVFAFGSFFLMIAWAITFGVNGGDAEPPAEFLAFNPFAGIGDALPRQENFFTGDTFSPFGGMRSAIDELGNGNGGFDENGNRINDDRGPFVWIYYVVIGVFVTALSIRSSAKAVSTPADSER